MKAFKHILFILLVSVLAAAQNGLSDFRPSASSPGGFVLNVSGGIANISNVPTVITGKSLYLAANTINYVYVDLSAGSISFNTTGFTSTQFPVAIVTTSTTQVSNVQDVRAYTGGGTAATSTAHGISLVLSCEAASASGTAYTCTTAPSFTPADMDTVLFEADVANTGSATLAVNGAAAKTIMKQGGGTALVANDLLAGQWTLLTYDGTNWQMQGQTGNATGGAPAFSAITAGSNTAAAMSEGGTASLVPVTTGQVTANGLFHSSAGLAGIPIPPALSQASLAWVNTGGSFLNATHYYFVITSVAASGESKRSAEVDTSAVSPCTGGSTTCSVVITMPSWCTLPAAGITGCTVYDSAVASGANSELKSTCINITTATCTLTGLAAGAALPAAQTGLVPPGTIVNDCPTATNPGILANPFEYMLRGDGKWHIAGGLDMSQGSGTGVNQTPPPIGGTRIYCYRGFYTDTGYNAQAIAGMPSFAAQSLLGVLHYSGAQGGGICVIGGVACDDRALYVSNWNPLGDASTYTGGMWAIYNEAGIYGHPNLSQGPGTVNAMAGIRTNMFLSSDVANKAFAGMGTGHIAILELNSGNWTGGTISGAAMAGVVSIPGNNATNVNQTAALGSFVAQLANNCAACLNAAWVGYTALSPTQAGAQPAGTNGSTTNNFGFDAENFGAAPGAIGFISKQDGTAGSFAFQASNAASTSQFGKLQTTGAVTMVNNTVTVGATGVPAEYGIDNVTGSSATRTAVNILASTPAAGEYIVNWYIDQNAPCTTGSNSVTVAINWTDATAARVSGTLGTLTTTTSSSSTGAFAQGTFTLWAASASAITDTTTYVGTCTTGTSSYDFHADVKRVQ